MCQVLRTQWHAKQILPSLLEHHFTSLEDQEHLPLIGCFYHMIPFSCHFTYISFLRVTELICMIISSTAANCYCFAWPITLPFGELVCSTPCNSSRAISQGASIPYPSDRHMAEDRKHIPLSWMQRLFQFRHVV